MARKSWLGIESIEEGDKIRYALPTGVGCKAIVYKILGETLSAEHGLCLRFYSERVAYTTRDSYSFERVIPEEWITHWRGRRLRSSSAENRPVDSSTTGGSGHQIKLPIQEGP